MTDHMDTYADAVNRCVSRGKPAVSRKIANNTWIEQRPAGAYAIRLHATDIVTYRPDGSVILATGGWFSVTTKARINDYGPAGIRVDSVRGSWRVAGAPFVDGMTLRPVAGGWSADTDALTMAAHRAMDAHNARTRRDIVNYCNRFRLTLAADGSASTAGDCFICLVHGSAGPDDVDTDTGHLSSHMSENYYVATLLMLAGREAGYGAHLWLTVERDGRLNALGRRVLRRYLSRRLLVGVAVTGGYGRMTHPDAISWYRDTLPAATAVSA